MTRPLSVARTAFVPEWPGARLSPLRRLVRLWIRRDRSRRALAELEPRMLCDIGVDPGAAAAEAAKPFWRA